jgi:hypothetical protein
MKSLLAMTAAAVALAVAAPPALASGCQRYTATGRDAATSPAGPYVGTQDVTMGSTSYSDVPAVTSILAPLGPAGDSGVLTTTTSHAISLPSGTITTADSAQLIPTSVVGVYKLVAHLVIVGGATGQLQLQATIDFATLSAEGTIVGTVCGLG